LVLANVVTINRPEVVALIERGVKLMTGGNKTEAVAMSMRELIKKNERVGTLFGAHPGSVTFSDDYDPFAPALDVMPDAESGREIDR
jgi:hypothetical protein